MSERLDQGCPWRQRKRRLILQGRQRALPALAGSERLRSACYLPLLGDGKAYVDWVMTFLLALGFPLAYQATGHGGGGNVSST